MDIRALMTPDVCTCSPADSVHRAAKLLWDNDCGALPVVESGRLRGMITDRDICMAAYTRGKRLEEMTVGSVMSRGVVSCRVDDSLETAETLMARHGVRRLPVVDLADRLVGILTLADLARHARTSGPGDYDALSARAVARTLAIVASPREEALARSAA